MRPVQSSRGRIELVCGEYACRPAWHDVQDCPRLLKRDVCARFDSLALIPRPHFQSTLPWMLPRIASARQPLVSLCWRRPLSQQTRTLGPQLANTLNLIQGVALTMQQSRGSKRATVLCRGGRTQTAQRRLFTFSAGHMHCPEAICQGEFLTTEAEPQRRTA